MTGGSDNYQFAEVTNGAIAPTNSSAMPASASLTNNVNYTVNGSLTYTNAGTNVAGSLNIVSASAGTLTLNGGSNQFRSRAGRHPPRQRRLRDQLDQRNHVYRSGH